MMRAVVVALMLVCFPTASWAGVSRANARKAKMLYRSAQKAYKNGQYSHAANLFKRAHGFDPRPAFLLNVAQSYRMAKMPSEAIDYFEQFLAAAPRTRMRAQVQGLIDDLRKTLPKPEPPITPPPPKKDPQKKPPPFVRTDPIPPANPPTTSGGTAFYKTWWFWTAVGVVVVGTATGVGVAAASASGPDYVKEGGLGAVRW